MAAEDRIPGRDPIQESFLPLEKGDAKMPAQRGGRGPSPKAEARTTGHDKKPARECIPCLSKGSMHASMCACVSTEGENLHVYTHAHGIKEIHPKPQRESVFSFCLSYSPRS